jgi:hypothetical protein
MSEKHSGKKNSKSNAYETFNQPTQETKSKILIFKEP